MIRRGPSGPRRLSSAPAIYQEKCLSLGTGEGMAIAMAAKSRLEQAGGVLILQFLAEFDQFLLKGQKPVTDRVRQVAVVHCGIG